MISSTEPMTPWVSRYPAASSLSSSGVAMSVTWYSPFTNTHMGSSRASSSSISSASGLAPRLMDLMFLRSVTMGAHPPYSSLISRHLKQLVRWSFTMPTLCMYAYTMVGPTKLKPWPFRSLAILVERSVLDGT